MAIRNGLGCCCGCYSWTDEFTRNGSNPDQTEPDGVNIVNGDEYVFTTGDWILDAGNFNNLTCVTADSPIQIYHGLGFVQAQAKFNIVGDYLILTNGRYTVRYDLVADSGRGVRGFKVTFDGVETLMYNTSTGPFPIKFTATLREVSCDTSNCDGDTACIEQNEYLCLAIEGSGDFVVSQSHNVLPVPFETPSLGPDARNIIRGETINLENPGTWVVTCSSGVNISLVRVNTNKLPCIRTHPRGTDICENGLADSAEITLSGYTDQLIAGYTWNFSELNGVHVLDRPYPKKYSAQGGNHNNIYGGLLIIDDYLGSTTISVDDGFGGTSYVNVSLSLGLYYRFWRHTAPHKIQVGCVISINTYHSTVNFQTPVHPTDITPIHLYEPWDNRYVEFTSFCGGTSTSLERIYTSFQTPSLSVSFIPN